MNGIKWILLLFALAGAGFRLYAQGIAVITTPEKARSFVLQREESLLAVSLQAGNLASGSVGAALSLHLGNHIGIDTEFLYSVGSIEETDRESFETVNYKLLLFPFQSSGLYVASGISKRRWKFTKKESELVDSAYVSKKIEVECPENGSVVGLGFRWLITSKIMQELGSLASQFGVSYYRIRGDSCEITEADNYSASEQNSYLDDINDKYETTQYFAVTYGFGF